MIDDRWGESSLWFVDQKCVPYEVEKYIAYFYSQNTVFWTLSLCSIVHRFVLIYQ